MDSRASTEGCVSLYVGDIEINLEHLATKEVFHEHEKVDIVG